MNDPVTQIILFFILIPVLAIVLVTVMSEKFRRFVIQVTAFISIIGLGFLFSYYITKPQTASSDSIDSLAIPEQLKISILVALVILFTLIVILFIFSNPIRKLNNQVRLAFARRKYLHDLIKYSEMEDYEYPTYLPEFNCSSPDRILILGEEGTGKSSFLKWMAGNQARKALKSRTERLPIFVSLDGDAGSGYGSRFVSFEALQPIVGSFVKRVIDQEAYVKGLAYFVDSSLLSFAPGYAPNTWKNDIVKELIFLTENEMNNIVFFAGTRELPDPKFHALFNKKFQLRKLTGPELTGILSKGKDNLEDPIQSILNIDSGLYELARIPFFLKLIRICFSINKPPSNIIEVIRFSSYPKKLSTTLVEKILSELALKMVTDRKTWLPLDELDSIIQSIKRENKKETIFTDIFSKPIFRIGRKFIREIAYDLNPRDPLKVIIESGIVRIQTSSGNEFVSFSHSSYMAYFLALAWYSNQLPPLTETDQFYNDPMLSEAFIIFTHMIPDKARLSHHLLGLLDQPGAFPVYLASRSIMALPAGSRPEDLLAKILTRLLKESENNQFIKQQTWSLLREYEQSFRLGIYIKVITSSSESKINDLLDQIFDNAPGDFPLLITHGEKRIGRLAGIKLAEIDPVMAEKTFSKILEAGSPEKRLLVIGLLGYLPEKIAEKKLYGLFRTENQLEFRIAIINSLEKANASIINTLFSIINNPGEDETLRTFAAGKLYDQRNRAELQLPNVIHDLVRLSRINLPEKARVYFQQLLEHLRYSNEITSNEISQAEKMVNPYIVGKPVVEASMFYGRDEIIYEVLSAIENGNHRLLKGERRIGKTSILKQVLANLDRQFQRGIPYFGVFIDLQGMEPPEELFYAEVLNNIVSQLHIPGSVITLFDQKYCRYDLFEESLYQIISYLVEKSSSSAKLILLLDEVDALIRFPQEMHSRLRRTFSSDISRNLVVILAGTDQNQYWTRPTSPFFNIFPPLEVPRFSAEAATKLIVEPVAGSFEYTQEAIDLIIRHTRGKPYEIQELCQKVINQMLLLGKWYISSTDVDQVLRTWLNSRTAVLSQIESIVADLFDWVENNPVNDQSIIDQKIHDTWKLVQDAIQKQVLENQKLKPTTFD